MTRVEGYAFPDKARADPMHLQQKAPEFSSRGFLLRHDPSALSVFVPF
jgi:hypothetical protein